MPNLVIFSLFLFFQVQSFSAPHPGVGSSVLNTLQNGSLFSQMGFKLNTVPVGWNLVASEKSDTSKELQIDLGKKFSITNDHLGRISFKSETTQKKVDLESYVKKYLRDYNQFGFEVSSLQSMREKNSVIVDINQKNKKTRSRQMFFQNGTRIVTATCVDEFENFDQTIKDCNLVFGGLGWK
jgi:hypothetical protein